MSPATLHLSDTFCHNGGGSMQSGIDWQAQEKETQSDAPTFVAANKTVLLR